MLLFYPVFDHGSTEGLCLFVSTGDTKFSPGRLNLHNHEMRKDRREKSDGLHVQEYAYKQVTKLHSLLELTRAELKKESAVGS